MASNSHARTHSPDLSSTGRKKEKRFSKLKSKVRSLMHPSWQRTSEWVLSQQNIDPSSRPSDETSHAEPWERRDSTESERHPSGPQDGLDLQLHLLFDDSFRNTSTPLVEANEEGRLLDNAVCYDRQCQICDPVPVQLRESLLLNGHGGFERRCSPESEGIVGSEDVWSTTTAEDEEIKQEKKALCRPKNRKEHKALRNYVCSRWSGLYSSLHSSTRRLIHLFPSQSDSGVPDKSASDRSAHVYPPPNSPISF